MKSKKIISLVLVLAVMLGAFATVFSFSTSAILNDDGTYTPEEGIETNRYYFAMPKAWENQYYEAAGSTAGIYWWDGTDKCGSVAGNGASLAWPGYKAKESGEQENLFYCDVPQDVPIVVWNNFVNGGQEKEDPIYLAACQAEDTHVGANEGYCEDDGTYYDDINGFWDLINDAWDNDTMDQFGENADCFAEGDYGLAICFNNMVYVIDPAKTSVNFEGKPTYIGEWFFMYDNGYYGSWPTKEMAEEQAAAGNGVYDTLANAINPAEDPEDPSQDPSQDPSEEPTPTNAPTQAPTKADDTQAVTQQESGKATPDAPTTPKSSTNSNASTTNKSAVQTGAVSYAIALLTILAMIAGVVFFVRKKRFN